MSFLRRLWRYVTKWFRGDIAQSRMKPEVEIEMAISEARRRDQALRNQAAKVVAHRTQIESKLERSADAVGEAREMAKQALLRAEDARAAGDAAGVDKWTRTAMAMKLQASENNLTTLKTQYGTASSQAEDAKKSVQTNAMEMQQLTAKKMELLGSLEAAKMQEAVNAAADSVQMTMDYDMPTLDAIEDKIEARKAMAKAELREATPQGAEAEFKEAISMVQADAKLEGLKAELGLTS